MYAIVIFGALVVIFPLYWMISTSFKTLEGSNQFPPTLLPREWDFNNYAEAWQTPPSSLGRYILNTVVYATVGTAGMLVIAVLAAYAFARLRFPGRDIVFLLVLATTMIPDEVTLIPRFVTIVHFPLFGENDLFGTGGNGLYDTYAGMILPNLAEPFMIFLLRQAFLGVPEDYWQAAQLDGVTGFGYLWRIMIPLTMPTVIAVAVLGFVDRWNDLLWPLIVTRSESIRPVQVAMLYYQGEFVTDRGVLMAAGFLVTVPVIVLYAVAQRYFIEGVINSGLKG